MQRLDAAGLDQGPLDTYYRRRAGELQAGLSWFRAAEAAVAVLGAALGATAAAVGGSSFAPWIAVVTTVTTALAVHVAATRYVHQLIEFLRTADRLEQLRSKAVAGASVRSWTRWRCRRTAPSPSRTPSEQTAADTS